jgi:hypothetical protein
VPIPEQRPVRALLRLRPRVRPHGPPAELDGARRWPRAPHPACTAASARPRQETPVQQQTKRQLIISTMSNHSFYQSDNNCAHGPQLQLDCGKRHLCSSKPSVSLSQQPHSHSTVAANARGQGADAGRCGQQDAGMVGRSIPVNIIDTLALSA